MKFILETDYIIDRRDHEPVESHADVISRQSEHQDLLHKEEKTWLVIISSLHDYVMHEFLDYGITFQLWKNVRERERERTGVTSVT